MMRPKDEDILLGIEVPEIYDGVAVWVLKDGTLVNRFAGEAGYERRAERIQAYIDAQDPETVKRAAEAKLAPPEPVDYKVEIWEIHSYHLTVNALSADAATEEANRILQESSPEDAGAAYGDAWVDVMEAEEVKP